MKSVVLEDTFFKSYNIINALKNSLVVFKLSNISVITKSLHTGLDEGDTLPDETRLAVT